MPVGTQRRTSGGSLQGLTPEETRATVGIINSPGNRDQMDGPRSGSHSKMLMSSNEWNSNEGPRWQRIEIAPLPHRMFQMDSGDR